MVRRERHEKMAFARFVASLVAPLSGMSAEGLTSMLEAYGQHVNHNVYRLPPASRKTTAQRENEDLLAKVDKLTVSDEDMPPPKPPPKRGGQRRRRR